MWLVTMGMGEVPWSFRAGDGARRGWVMEAGGWEDGRPF